MPVVLLSLFACASVDPTPTVTLPAMAAPDLPGPVSIPVVTEEPTLGPASTPATGMYSAHSLPVDQAIGWDTPKKGALLGAALRERRLVYKALGEAAPADAPAPTPVQVAGGEGLRWEVVGAETWFVGTSFECPSHRVALTSFGRSGADSLVALVHAASESGARCLPVPAEVPADSVPTDSVPAAPAPAGG